MQALHEQNFSFGTGFGSTKQKARATYDSFLNKENVGSRKKTKNTSGSVVSPTASVRPPAKRMDRCRLFANRESTWTRLNNNY